MMDISKHHQSDPGEKKIILLEFIAATSIFMIVALVLYMVFTYRPA